MQGQGYRDGCDATLKPRLGIIHAQGMVGGCSVCLIGRWKFESMTGPSVEDFRVSQLNQVHLNSEYRVWIWKETSQQTRSWVNGIRT